MDYPYANGTIKALETKIQDRSKLLVLSKYDKAEFVKVLLAMNYGTEGTTVEDIINSELKKVKNTIDELTPNKEDTDLFYLTTDAQNIKILYKIKKFNLDKFELLSNDGSMIKESLVEAIIDNNYENLTKKEKKLIERLDKVLEEIDSPKKLSAVIDNEIYRFAISKTKNKVLKKYLTIKIDVTNLLSLLRAENLNWKLDSYYEMFIEGGTISKEVFASIYKEDIATKAKLLSEYYEGKISKLLNNNLSFNRIEIIFNRFILEQMEIDKFEPLDIGPMIYYYLLKQAEAQNIRILYSAEKPELKDLI